MSPSVDARIIIVVALAHLHVLCANSGSLPRRLVVALDGISYRDMAVLQGGVTYTNRDGQVFRRQAFHRGYYPVSRLISTFPSASDVSWTTLLANRPLPGYQRTHYSKAANAVLHVNGVSTSMEFERQMTWRMAEGFGRAMSFIHPLRAYEYEVKELSNHFLNSQTTNDIFYGYIYSSDPAQHMACDVFALLCMLDTELETLRTLYKAREGRELEILLLSDHGNNHVGPGKRVKVRSFLRKAGYQITESILEPRDVVLPTVGMESWVEIHNAPAETERLVQLLWRMEGVDMVTAQAPGQADRFLVVNAKGESASIQWDQTRDSFKYTTEKGDPLRYLPVAAQLAREHQLDEKGFASSEAWMNLTLAHRYPVALERIAHAHTRVVLNPATILISLDNAYVHSSWLVKAGSGLVTCAGTHGGLDDATSTGVLLSNFAPTRDTTATRVAALYGGFPGRRDYRATESGAEWSCCNPQRAMSHPGTAVNCDPHPQNQAQAWLRVWSPELRRSPGDTSLLLTMKRDAANAGAPTRRGDPDPVIASTKHICLSNPQVLPDNCEDRFYALPPDLRLDPGKLYQISGRLPDPITKKDRQLFQFKFRTDNRGMPVVY